MENDNLVPEAAAVTAPKEVRSKKWLFISILILIIGGALVYFVSGGNEFEGRITEDLTPLELANSEMEKISPYASVVEEGDLKWPLIVGKTTAFSLTDKRDISLFTPGDSIDVKWLKANFEAEVSAGRVTVSDTTEAFGIENHQVCVTFDQDEETCYSKEEISIGAKFSKEYQTGGSHLIKSTVSDQSGHSDSFEQEIEVSILTEGSPVEEEGDEGGGMPVSPVEDEPVEEEGDEGGGMPVSPVEDEPVVESDDGGGMAQMALEPAQAPDMSCTATRIGQTYEVNFVLTNNEALFPITDFEWIWDFKGGSSPRSGGLEENHTYTGPGDYPVTATGTGGAEEVVVDCSINLPAPAPLDQRFQLNMDLDLEPQTDGEFDLSKGEQNEEYSLEQESPINAGSLLKEPKFDFSKFNSVLHIATAEEANASSQLIPLGATLYLLPNCQAGDLSVQLKPEGKDVMANLTVIADPKCEAESVAVAPLQAICAVDKHNVAIGEEFVLSGQDSTGPAEKGYWIGQDNELLESYDMTLGGQGRFTSSLYQAGEHQFTFTIRSLELGTESSCTATVTVEEAPEDIDPVANLLNPSCQISNLVPAAGQTVFFEGEASTGDITTGYWDFGTGEGERYHFDLTNNESTNTEYTYSSPGQYNVTLHLEDGAEASECTRAISVVASPPLTFCADGIDNDGDGLTDLDDTGCRSRGDNDESNGYARVTTACSDGLDNDNDGFNDLEDIGCQSAFDNSEENPHDNILVGGEAAQQVCIRQSETPVSFIDIESSFARDIILDLASSYYDGNDPEFKGDFIIEGYETDDGLEFRGDQPIRRDETLKILTLSTCLIEQNLTPTGDTTEYNFTDPEFEDESYWAKKFIFRAANKGLINKVAKTHPDSSVTRGEFAKMLVMLDSKLRGTEIENCENGEELAADLDFKHWSCRYFKTINTLNIAGGITDLNGNFRLYPNGILDRANATVWLNNYISVINGQN